MPSACRAGTAYADDNADKPPAQPARSRRHAVLPPPRVVPAATGDGPEMISKPARTVCTPPEFRRYRYAAPIVVAVTPRYNASPSVHMRPTSEVRQICRSACLMPPPPRFHASAAARSHATTAHASVGTPGDTALRVSFNTAGITYAFIDLSARCARKRYVKGAGQDARTDGAARAAARRAA